MKKFISFFAAAILSLGFVSAAQAATWNATALTAADFQAWSTGLEQSYGQAGSGWSSVGTGTVGLYDKNILSSHVLSYDSADKSVVSPIKKGNYYLAALANGKAAYTFTEPVTEISFDWGTVDSYNKLLVYTADSSSAPAYTITGLDLMKSPDGHTGFHFSLADAAGIAKIVFFSEGSNAFEMKNLVATPLPAALGLFGAALFGTALRRRRAA